MRKKRILAGIMSLLLIFTSVFTGNVVTARAEEEKSVISEASYREGKYVVGTGATSTSFQSVLIPDGCCFIVETEITVIDAITVNPGGRLEVLGNGSITCGSFSVGDSVVGKDPSLYFGKTSNVPIIDGGTALGLYKTSDDGVLNEITNVQYSEFIYDYDEKNWVWFMFNSYDAFESNENYPTLVEVTLQGYERGNGGFPIIFDGVADTNKIDGWDRMKARVKGNSLTISWNDSAEVKPLQICVEGAGEDNDWLIVNVGKLTTNSYTISLSDTNKDSYFVQVKYQLDQGAGDGDNGVNYTENATISANVTKNDITVSAGTLTIGDCSVRVDHKLDVKSGASIVGTSESSKLIFAGRAFSSGIELYYQDEKVSSGTNNDYTNNGDGPAEFLWNTTSKRWVTQQEPAKGGPTSYGKYNCLAFNISHPENGDVYFQVNDTKYRVGGDNQYDESDIINNLKDTEFAKGNTITIWAEKRDGANVSHFDIQVAGTSVFYNDDTAKDAAKNAAQEGSGYTFTVPDDYKSNKQIEFQIEFLSGGGGDNDVTYTEDATISEDTTKNDITVSAGTLTIDNCSVRVEHQLVVKTGANIVGTSASSKLIFASGAFSNGIALYYQEEKISDDNNNYFSNNGDGLVEFKWDTTSRRWVTEQPPAEGGGDALWYTVSYGNSANLTTKNGKVYAERVHIGDITYSSIASEYNASTTDKIYSMEDTIFHKKTQEEENDPNYKDSLTKYGIGGSDGDIFIRKDVSGVSIDFKFIPDFGYQLTNIYTNENETESLLNQFTAAETVSSFTFDVIQGCNVHFEVKFVKVDNKVTGNAGFASSAKIESVNAATSGTLEMTVDNATASDAVPSGSEALGAYDITLTNVVSKGENRGSWNTLLEDLGENKATVTLPVKNADTTNYTYTVIREHEGEDPATLNATVTDGAISFDTNKFSTYTIVKTPIIRSIEKAEITLGDALTYNGAAQTQTIASVKVDGRILTADTDYTISGNIGTNAGTYTLTITGKGNYTGTAPKNWIIARKNISGATITLGDALTYNGAQQTQTVSSVKLGESALIAGTDYTISGNVQKDAGTYTLTVTGNGNYEGTVTKQFTISKATLTPALSGTTTKVYDNTTTVTSKDNLTLSVTGLMNSETVTVTATGYAYDNANVGTGKTITAIGISISGDAAKNYELSGTTATVAGGVITQATPTITLSNLTETTQAPTGVKATLSPTDATATVKIEYQLSDGQWVETRPVAPGTYKVRAYLPKATTNLAAVGVENAVTNTYTLTKYTAPSGGGSNNNSGTGSGSSSGGSSSDTTTTNTPVLVETVTATGTTTPNKTTQPTEVITTTKTPSKTEEKPDEKLVLPYQQAKEEPVSGTLQVSFGEGTVKVSVESQDEIGNTKGDGIIGVALGSFDNVLNAVLTEEEKNEVKAGNTVEVRLSMKKLTQEIPATEKTAMEKLVAQKSSQISGLTIGTYMDISMEKKLGNKDWKKLTNLNEEVEITIDVPKDLQMDRAQYWVVKNHNGEVSLLEDLDKKKDTITIKSREFSTYAIAYAVSNVEDADGVEGVENVSVEEVQTQEAGLAWYWWLLPVAVVVIAIVGYTVYKKNSSDEE